MMCKLHGVVTCRIFEQKEAERRSKKILFLEQTEAEGILVTKKVCLNDGDYHRWGLQVAQGQQDAASHSAVVTDLR